MGRIPLAFVVLFLSPFACRPSSSSDAEKRTAAAKVDEGKGVSLSAVKKPAAPRLVAPASSPASSASSAALRATPPAAPPAAPRVIVVGGGLAGLVAAYELERRGFTSHVLEAGPFFGGRVATAEYPGGATAEYGLQEMWQGNPLLSIVKELELPLDEHPEPSYSSVVIDGKLYPYIQESRHAFLSSLMAAPEKLQLNAWLVEANRLRALAEREGLRNVEVSSLQPISFAKWVQDSKLPRPASEFVRLLIECELATDWQNFSALFGLLEFGVFLGDGLTSQHVRGGNSRLITGLSEALHGDKTLSALVTRIERWKNESGQLAVRVHYQHDRKTYTIEGERVVLAVPFWRLHQIEMIPPLSTEKWQAVQTLSRGQYTVVHMLMQQPKEVRRLWLVDGKNPFSVLTSGPLGVVYGVHDAKPPQSETEVFSLLIHGQYAAAFHMIPRELRLGEVYGELEKLWPGFSQFVKSSYVYTYHPGAIPVWPPGRSPLDEPAQKLREPELGLHLAGDYLYNAHSDGAARSGIAAAERIAAELAALPPPRRVPPNRRIPPPMSPRSNAPKVPGSQPAAPRQAPPAPR